MYDPLVPSVTWCGIVISVLRAPERRCCGRNMVLETPGSPFAVLDVGAVHLALRQQRQCHKCRARAAVGSDQIRDYWRSRGVVAICASRVEGVSSRGRTAVWHTVGFVVSLYEAFRRLGTFDGVRRDIMQRLWHRHLAVARSSIAFAYEASFVPASLTLRSMLLYFHKSVTVPRIGEAKRLIACRSRVWKIDGARKLPLRVHVSMSSHVDLHTVAMTVMTEEGFLAFSATPRAGRGEPRCLSAYQGVGGASRGKR